MYIVRRSGWRRRGAAIIASLAFVTACAGRSDVSSGGAAPPLRVRDSAGVQIVEVPGALLDSLPLLRRSDTPTLSLGGPTGEKPYLFSRIAAARRLATGEIVVTDESLELRVFGPDGKFRRSFGRRGNGPGEFAGYPLGISQTDGRSVAVHDVPTARLTLMNLETGEFVTHPLSGRCRESGDTVLRRCSVRHLLPDGSVFGSYVAAAATHEPDDRGYAGHLDLRFGVLNSESLRVIESVPTEATVRTAEGSDFFSASAPFEPGGQVALGAKSIVFGSPMTYELRVRGGDGALQRVIRVEREQRQVTSELLDSYRRWADTAKTHALVRTYLASMRPGQPIPFLGELRVDRAGRIWLRDYQPSSWWAPRTQTLWTILRSDGTPVARFEPGRGTILEAGEDYVMVLETDSDGVEYVRMYGIAAAESGT